MDKKAQDFAEANGFKVTDVLALLKTTPTDWGEVFECDGVTYYLSHLDIRHLNRKYNG